MTTKNFICENLIHAKDFVFCKIFHEQNEKLLRSFVNNSEVPCEENAVIDSE